MHFRLLCASICKSNKTIEKNSQQFLTTQPAVKIISSTLIRPFIIKIFTVITHENSKITFSSTNRTGKNFQHVKNEENYFTTTWEEKAKSRGRRKVFIFLESCWISRWLNWMFEKRTGTLFDSSTSMWWSKHKNQRQCVYF